MLLFASQGHAAKGYTGNSAPATCTVGDFWIDTDAAAADRFHTCTAADTWTKNRSLAGDCTEPPCLDGSADGGNSITLHAPTGGNGTWTNLQGGNPVANRMWRLPIDAPPAAGTTRLLNVDENAQMGLVDPATLGSDDLGSATYSDVVALWTPCAGYLKSDGTCDTPSGSATYPGAAGVANWNGSAWGTSYTVGTAAGNLVALDGSGDLALNTVDATFASVTVTRTTSPSALDLYEGTGEPGDNKLMLTLSGGLAADTMLYADQILVDGDIGSTVQAYDADLTTAAGASAAGVSKYFGTNTSSVVGFYDLPAGGGTPTTITVADTTDTTAYVALFDSATGDLGPKTDTGITYNASTGMLTATGFTGPLTGTASGNLTTSSTSTLTNKTIDTAATGNAITVPLNGVLDGAITDPADADDMIYKKAQNAITLTDIHCLAEGGGTITLTLQECTTAGASCANIETAITCDADGAEDDGTLSDASIAAGAWIKVLYSAPTGTVNNVAWTVYGTQTW